MKVREGERKGGRRGRWREKWSGDEQWVQGSVRK